MAGKMKDRKDGKCFVRRAPSGGTYLICHSKKELERQKKETAKNKKKAEKQRKEFIAKRKKENIARKKKGLKPLPIKAKKKK
tara:strand:- start:1321 stop:1566 length:246 start_codon:yes stop_codon:yes gene_type:complete